jgi:hypothetical protein
MRQDLKSMLLAAALTAAIVFVAAFGAWTGSAFSADQHCNQAAGKPHQDAETCTPSIAPPKSAEDRIADYTWWLCAFTLLLGVVSIVQIVFLTRADQAAARAFIATHRPKIIVRDFRLTEPEIPRDEPMNFIFVAHNIGVSPAKITGLRSATFVQRSDLPLPPNLGFPHHQPFNYDMESGTHELIPGNGGFRPEGNEAMEIFAGSCALYCMGVLIYQDNIGIRRETAFCRRFRPREDRWETIECEYEYAY